MLKKIKLQNSTLILLGILLILSGIFFGMYDYFVTKKDRTFTEMNVLLYESEMPEEIEEEDIVNPQPESPENNEPSEEQNEQTSNVQKPVGYNYIGILEIPKINLKRGFLDLNSRYNNVDYNITVINGSTFPDTTNNNLILAAHSGNCNYCFFDKLYKLSKGDNAYLYYKNIKHTYKIVNIYEVEKDGTVAISRDHTKNCLTLITCTRNSNTKQTVYILEEI